MSERTKVETYKVGADKKAPAEQVLPAPVRSVPGKHGSTSAKMAARVAHTELGYTVRSVSFTAVGIMVYVDGEPAAPFNSAKSGPRGSRRRKRSR